MKSLSHLLLITDRGFMLPSFADALEAALRGGARLIQMREKDLTARGVLQLAEQAQMLCEKNGAKLLINARADIARVVGAAGVHLPEDGLPPVEARLCLEAEALCGVSVHSLEAAQRAETEGADYLVFGPVFATASHPGQAAAGLEALRGVAAATALPVFAVGGVTARTAEDCLAAGAHGVAVIRAVWQQKNVEEATRELLAAIGS